MISRRAALLVSLGLALPGRAAARASDDLPVPPLYTPALARKLEPALFPFAAEYAKGSRSLLVYSPVAGRMTAGAAPWISASNGRQARSPLRLRF
jgi:hypothetical protein